MHKVKGELTVDSGRVATIYNNLLLLAAGIVLGIGHIGIHLRHKYEIEKTTE